MVMRVLALCGFTQNAHIYSKQLGAIRKTCKEVEFVFCEPPVVVKKADMPWAQSTASFGSDATTDEDAQTPETTPRAWFLSRDRSSLLGMFSPLPYSSLSDFSEIPETMAYMHDFLVRHGPFDGAMGFSQGGCMAALLAALLEKPNLDPSWPSEPRIPPFKFIICVGGFFPNTTNPNFYPWFPLPAHLSTLHVIGKNDVIVTEERSRGLIAQCENARVEYHEGGHFTPSKASWRHFFNAYIMSFVPGGDQGDVPPPSSFGPGGKSGISTPILPE
ncbi:hypothetical protein TREMEDRAFT_39324 [Tremella mesenterica DSM 1558]|uniref:uncharacterized protein n=1 Tax=Tremella mesenterica (strain ATCC 24925 / CBS 8224 / DSM 1558 / NBRC 9311 / NRRL Y-6157 / RJB 2259-6 / UBC 559-6) TaxID=578456 RepID=UPI0003F497F7|nr:uncharacterized protein TREMEDRAFT_39324 [Tremella mesenterica DSM 1558]EIW69009.1 hypothetical protein TREMEDRAFT_39324 [Tremella mesenterica DSM 1558]